MSRYLRIRQRHLSTAELCCRRVEYVANNPKLRLAEHDIMKHASSGENTACLLWQAEIYTG